MQKKFDLDAAWRDCTRLMADNRTLLAAMAGIFFFLPYAVLLVALPAIATLPQPAPGADIGTILAAMREFYAEAWWALALAGLVVTTGILAMLALLRRRENPTVGQAMQSGLAALLPFFAAMVLQGIVILLFGALMGAAAQATGLTALILLTFVASTVFEFFVMVRLSLVAPRLAAAGERNPLRAMRSSWELTRGHALRLFAFYALVLSAFMVVALVVSMIVSVLLALAGQEAADFGSAVVSAGLMSVLLTLWSCLLAAVHMQLARRPTAG